MDVSSGLTPCYIPTLRTTICNCVNIPQAVGKEAVTTTAITITIMPITARFRTIETTAAVSQSAVSWIGITTDHNYYLVLR